MNILPLIKNPHPILREIARPVILSQIPQYKNLIEDMIATMYEDHGIGLAAPQVGYSLRLIIVATDKGPLPLINPVILKHSSLEDIEEEGCLSVPGVFGMVKRYQRIKVHVLDRDGKEKKISAHGLFARVIQHELDHINGILIIDKFENISS